MIPKIAAMSQSWFPNDSRITRQAPEYLLHQLASIRCTIAGCPWKQPSRVQGLCGVRQGTFHTGGRGVWSTGSIKKQSMGRKHTWGFGSQRAPGDTWPCHGWDKCYLGWRMWRGSIWGPLVEGTQGCSHIWHRYRHVSPPPPKKKKTILPFMSMVSSLRNLQQKDVWSNWRKAFPQCVFVSAQSSLLLLLSKDLGQHIPAQYPCYSLAATEPWGSDEDWAMWTLRSSAVCTTPKWRLRTQECAT